LPIVIAGDDDQFTDGNPGRSKAEVVSTQVENVSCRFPVFTSLKGEPKDFNDLHCREGLDALRDALHRKTASAFDAFTFDGDFDPASLPERPWIIMRLLLRGYVTAVIAPPGVGKSTFAAIMAVMVATGWEKKMLNRPVLEQTNVLLLNNEDDEDELKRQIAGICQHYDIGFGELTNRLFVKSGYMTNY
jgi:hypothetical protein